MKKFISLLLSISIIASVVTVTTGQAYASDIDNAFDFGYDNTPEVYESGYYGHYHDAKHINHIWYGSPIIY